MAQEKEIKKIKKKNKMPVVRFLSLGYLITISIGTLLLLLPFAVKGTDKPVIENFGDWINMFFNTFLTATSATCVTGLIAYDTFDHWTMFGQIVILILIQIGGLGFMTIISLIFKMIKRKISLYENTVLMQSAGSYSIGDIKGLLRCIVIGTLIIETIGAGILAWRLRTAYNYEMGKAIYYGIFHSISAFCNAGFDLFGGFRSLTGFVTDIPINITISALILLGGLGFIVWYDLILKIFKRKKFELHTKVVLVYNIAIVLFSLIFYFIFEYSNTTMAGLTFGQKILASGFMAVTPRTAGFNTIDLAALTPSSKLFTIILMFIGGCSGSTAGGVKVTTIVIVVANLIAAAKHHSDIVIFKRRISNDLVKQASALFLSYLSIVLFATILICAVEGGFGVRTYLFEDILFEIVSGIGTVGLGMLKVTDLTLFTRIFLILLMYIGRVGAFTIFAVFLEKKNGRMVQSPRGNMLVG